MSFAFRSATEILWFYDLNIRFACIIKLKLPKIEPETLLGWQVRGRIILNYEEYHINLYGCRGHRAD